MFKRRLSGSGSGTGSTSTHERQSSAPLSQISHSASASSSISTAGGKRHAERERDGSTSLSLKEYRVASAAAQRGVGGSSGGTGRGMGVKEVVNGPGRIVGTLVNRLLIKLPHSSGAPSSSLDSDPIALQTIASLISLSLTSRAHLSAVLSALLGALDPLVRQTAAVSSAGMSTHALESEAVLLRVVYACLSGEWERGHAKRDDKGAGTKTQPWADPHELEDGVAKQLLGLLLALTRQITFITPLEEGSGVAAGPGKSWPLPGTCTTKGAMVLRTVPGVGRAASTVPGISTMRHLHCSDSVPSVGLGYRSPPGRKLKLAVERELDPSHEDDSGLSRRHSLPASPTTSTRSLPLSTASAFQRIERYTGRIVFFLSSSNWGLVRSRILSRLSNLASREGDERDASELRIVAWCNLDYDKLVSLTQAFSANFLALRPQHQALLAQLSRTAIVNSLSLYPAAWSDLLANGRNLDRSLEQLCDIACQVGGGEGSRSRTPPGWAWPLVTASLLVCPDTMKKVVAEMGRTSTSRKAQVLQSIIIDARTALPSLLCQVDILTTASLLASRPTSLHSLAEDLAADQGLADALVSHSQRDDQLAIEGIAARAQCLPLDAAVRSIAELVRQREDSATSRLGARACLLLVLEAQRSSSLQLIGQLYRNLSPVFRALLKSLCTGTGSLSKADHGLLMSLIQLYRNDVTFLLRNCHPIGPARTGSEIIGKPHPKGLYDEQYDTRDGADGLPHALEAIAALLASASHANGRHEAAELLHHIWQCSRAAGYDADEALGLKRAVTKTCPGAIAVAAKQVLLAIQNCKAYGEDLVVLQVLTTAGIAVLQEMVNHCGPASPAEWEAIAASLAVAEIALLCSLTLPDVAAPARSIRVLRSLIQLLGNGDHQRSIVVKDPSLPLRSELYEQLLPPGEIVGPQILQKFLRGVLRTYAVPCPLLLAVWQQLAQRLYGLLAIVIGSDAAPQTMTSRGRFDVEGLSDTEAQELRNIGCALSAMANVSTPAALGSGDPRQLVAVFDGLNLPMMPDLDEDPTAVLHAYLDQQVDLLVADAAFVRVAAQDALGTDLPPGHEDYLLSQIFELLGHAFLPDADIHEDVLDNLCLGALGILEKRHGSDSGLPASPTLDRTVRRMIAYAASMRPGVLALRCRIKICLLVKGCGLSLDSQSLQMVVLWAVNAPTESRNAKLSESDRLQRDLNAACINAFAAGSGRAVDSAGAYQEADLTDHLSWLISMVAKDEPVGALQDSLVAGLANICQQATGFKRCIKLARDTDNIILREILIQALSQSVAAGGAGSAQPARASLAFSDLLLKYPAQILPAISLACLQDDHMAGVLYRIFAAKGRSLELLDHLVRFEVETTDEVAGLFRTNSLCTRMFAVFVQQDSATWYYFHVLLCTLFKDLAAGKEVDTKLQLEEYDVSEEKNPQTVNFIRQVCERMVERLQANVIPIHLRAILDVVAKRAAAKSPAATINALSGLIFLRLLCPAMAAPERFGLSVTEDLIRPGRWCSKIFNVISTGNTFKENLKAFNPLVVKSQSTVAEYLLQLPAGEGARGLGHSGMAVEMPLDDQECDEIYWRNFASQKQNVESLLTAARLPDGETLTRDLTQALSSKPLDAKISPKNAEAHLERLRHLGNKRAHGSFDDIFFEAERSLDGHRLFYLIVSKLDLDDQDAVIAHIVSHLANTVNDQFDVIVDLCETEELRMPGAKILAQLLAVLDVARVGILRTLAVFAPTFESGDVLRRIALALPERMEARIVATSSLAELSKIVNFTNSGLPERTMAAATLASPVSISDVLYHGPGQTHPLPCLVSLGPSCITVQTRAKTELLPRINSCLTAVFRYDQLDAKLESRFSGSQKGRVTSLFNDLRSRRIGSAPQQQEAALFHSDHAVASLLCLGFRGVVEGLEGLTNRYMELLLACETALGDASPLDKMDHPAGNSEAAPGPQAALAVIERCAAAHPSLTPAYMQAWAADAANHSESTSHASVMSVRPWLANLPSLARRTDSGAVTSSLRALVASVPSRPSLLYDANVWQPLVRLGDVFLLDTLGQLLMARAGAEGPKAAGFASIAAALGLIMPVEGISRWASRLRKAIANTHTSPVAPTLDRHPNWREITAWVRVLAELLARPLKADEYPHLILAAPDITYSVLMLSGIGGEDDQGGVAELWRQFTRVIQRANHSVLNAASSVRNGIVATSEETSLPLASAAADHATICRPLIEFLSTASVPHAISNMWFTRLAGYVSSTCFQSNATTQGRAFAAFALLIEGDELVEPVEDDLMYQVLVAIRNALATYSGQHLLVTSMLDCLTSMQRILPPDTRYNGPIIFWLAVAVLQLDHQPLFLPALRLLGATLDEMSRQNLFANGEFVDVLMSYRQPDGPAREGQSRLEHSAGTDFDVSFSFSLVALLFKGLRVEASKPATVAIIRSCLEQIPQGHHALGLKMVLSALEATGTEVDALRTNVFVADLEHLDASDTLMAVACCIGMLGACEGDMEKVWVCQCLVNLEAQRPGALAMWQETLTPRLNVIINYTENIPLLDLATRLLAHIPLADGNAPGRSSSESSLGRAGSAASWPSAGVAALQDLGMEGLLELGFGEQNIDRIARKAEWAAPLFGV